MSIVRVLPGNRMIVCVLTPREASLIRDQLLDPGDFPWQDTEAQVTAAGFRAQLYEAVAGAATRELDASIGALLAPPEEEVAEEEETQAEQPPPMMEVRKETSEISRRVQPRWREALEALRGIPAREFQDPEGLASE